MSCKGRSRVLLNSENLFCFLQKQSIYLDDQIIKLAVASLYLSFIHGFTCPSAKSSQSLLPFLNNIHLHLHFKSKLQQNIYVRCQGCKRRVFSLFAIHRNKLYYGSPEVILHLDWFAFLSYRWCFFPSLNKNLFIYKKWYSHIDNKSFIIIVSTFDHFYK